MSNKDIRIFNIDTAEDLISGISPGQRASGRLHALDRIISSQTHEWKPASLTMIKDSIYYQIEQINKWSDTLEERVEEYKTIGIYPGFVENFNQEEKEKLEVFALSLIEDLKCEIALIDRVLNDKMKDIWLWVKSHLKKNQGDEYSDGGFALYGNRVFHYIKKGLDVDKWYNFSKSDLKDYVGKITKDLKLCINKVKNSKSDLHLVNLIHKNERSDFLYSLAGDNDILHEDDLEILNEIAERRLPYLKISSILDAYILNIQKLLSEFEENRTYEKPRKDDENRYVKRHFFVNSIYDLTLEDFGQPHHDFVAKISSIILNDDEIDTSKVRAIYNRKLRQATKE